MSQISIALLGFTLSSYVCLMCVCTNTMYNKISSLPEVHKMQLERIKIDWRPIKVKSGTMEWKISKALSIFLCTSSPYTKARAVCRLKINASIILNIP